MADEDPGVPGALSSAVRRLTEERAVELIDTLWLFPPLRRGRRESGVVAAGCLSGEPDAGDRRTLVTVAYRAEETGKGIVFEAQFQEEGEAPRDRLPRIMDGVVQRAREGMGEPRSIAVAGESERLEALLAELTPPPAEVTEHSIPRGPTQS